MRGIALKDIQWVATIEYKEYQDSVLVFSAVVFPTILLAIANVHSHVAERYPYEIISLKQQIVKFDNNI